MKGFLLDEQLPRKIRFTPGLPVIHASSLGESLSDSELWNYAKDNEFVIVSKDVDFSDRIIVSVPPPKVIHLRFGTIRKKQFHEFLARVWPIIEELKKITN